MYALALLVAVSATAKLPAAAASCNHDPIPRSLVQAKIPPSFAAKGIKSTANIQITLDNQGKLLDARVNQSSGDAQADAAAVAAVEASSFEPAQANCKSVGGTYLISETLDATNAGNAETSAVDPCNHDAVLQHAVTPVYPNLDPASRRGFTVTVLVGVGSDGWVTGASIVRSSGNPDVDNAALRAAQDSTYLAKTQGCKPVDGTYLFKAVFEPLF